MNEANTNNDSLFNTDAPNELQHIKQLPGLYRNWFLEYASYVILERAVPHIDDGLKPVQRRILHSLRRMDDGRYNKVANVIGHTMQFHPHGDASIGDALVQLGQKDLLIDTQGNWGNIFTGDNAAAARYIEARLSKFALDVVFNPKTTHWKLSYDGRNNEPITLPIKFPLLLVQGVEGIAVGLASKILPHNFNEVIDAAISHLRGDDFVLYPDFPTGGIADISKYNDGLRGGRVRVRARIEPYDKKTLVIRDIPFGTTTSSLIESILAANEKGKIKVRKIDDNTAANVEILVHLAPEVTPDQTIDALYAFTDCEVSISPNSCVIQQEKPIFAPVKMLLRYSADRTLQLLKQELEIALNELQEDWHFSSLEKIFIEKRIYRKIEECETWEAVLQTIDAGLKPFRKLFRRDITTDDIAKLTEIKIKRISRYDAFKADEHIKGLEAEMQNVRNNLQNIVNYTITYFQNIKQKYGAAYPRKTNLQEFDVIEAVKVVIRNEKLYINREEGFAGTSLKKDEFVCDCSDLDDIIVFRRDGTFAIMKISDKQFVGKEVIHIAVFHKNDEQTTYNVIYKDGETGYSFAKRFPVSGIIRDKEYNVTRGTKNSKILYFTANPNAQTEMVKISLRAAPRIRKTSFEFDFAQLDVKGRGSQGNIVTKYAVNKIVKISNGANTSKLQLWFDRSIMRLNTHQMGEYLGEFEEGDRLVEITKTGEYRYTGFEINTSFSPECISLHKHDPTRIYSVIYWDAEVQQSYIKRFELEETEKPVGFIGDHLQSYVISISRDTYPRVELTFGGVDKKRLPQIIDVSQFIGVKGSAAKGKRLTVFELERAEFIQPLVTEEKVQEFEQEMLRNKTPIIVDPDKVVQTTLSI